MANQEHLELLKQGVRMWNSWKREHPSLRPDLNGADLRKADLNGVRLGGANLEDANLSGADLRNAFLEDANLSGANLDGANLDDANLISTNLSNASLYKVELYEASLSKADLRGADLSEADLRRAFFMNADLRRANLSIAFLIDARLNDANLRGADLHLANLPGADLSNANLSYAHLNDANLQDANLSGANLCNAFLNDANLSEADLSNANLSEADLSRSILVGTNLTNATLKDCLIYGISAWDINLDGAKQLDLIITPDNQATITVDNLKIAQFIYLLLNNADIRDVIDTITSKVVLILGRFTPDRKATLDAIRSELRKRNYLPVLFDFEKPANRDITETISTLAHLARFVIADITDAKSIPQELMTIVPNVPSVPIQPLILTSKHEYGMFEHFTRFPWVLPVYQYTSQASLLRTLKKHVIEPAEQKANELAKR